MYCTQSKLIKIQKFDDSDDVDDEEDDNNDFRFYLKLQILNMQMTIRLTIREALL